MKPTFLFLFALAVNVAQAQVQENAPNHGIQMPESFHKELDERIQEQETTTVLSVETEFVTGAVTPQEPEWTPARFPIDFEKRERDELRTQIKLLNAKLDTLIESQVRLAAENDRLRNKVIVFEKERGGLVQDVGPKYTWVNDPDTGWPRPTRSVWVRKQVGSSVVFELVHNNGKPVPTSAIVINGYGGAPQQPQQQSGGSSAPE